MDGGDDEIYNLSEAGLWGIYSNMKQAIFQFTLAAYCFLGLHDIHFSQWSF